MDLGAVCNRILLAFQAGDFDTLIAVDGLNVGIGRVSQLRVPKLFLLAVLRKNTPEGRFTGPWIPNAFVEVYGDDEIDDWVLLFILSLLQNSVPRLAVISCDRRFRRGFVTYPFVDPMCIHGSLLDGRLQGTWAVSESDVEYAVASDGSLLRVSSYEVENISELLLAHLQATGQSDVAFLAARRSGEWTSQCSCPARCSRRAGPPPWPCQGGSFRRRKLPCQGRCRRKRRRRLPTCTGTAGLSPMCMSRARLTFTRGCSSIAFPCSNS